jgi:hypothetical protein
MTEPHRPRLFRRTRSHGGALFTVSTRTFHLTGYGLKIAHQWSRSGPGLDLKPEWSISIHGVAVADTDDVCVIGSWLLAREFDLTISSDRMVEQTWQEIKRSSLLAYGDKPINSPERRIRYSQYELLDKSPPTATLFLTDNAPESENNVSRWSLECKVSDTILDQLVTDIIVHQADIVNIGIKWAAGRLKADAWDTEMFQALSDEPISFTRNIWGLFKLPGEELPEPLRGHVSSFRWMLGTQRATQLRLSSERLSQVHNEWITYFWKLHQEKSDQDKDKPWMGRRSAQIVRRVAKTVLEWHREHEESPHNLRVRLNQAQRFVERLDGALHSKRGPIANESRFWNHLGHLEELYRTWKASDLVNFIDSFELYKVVVQYIDTPWLHSAYLDWLLLDAMTFAQIVGFYEFYAKRRYWIAYTLSGGAYWKMFLWRLALTPLTFLLRWGLPAVACYFIADWSVAGAVALGVVWYGLMLFMVAVGLWGLLSGKLTPSRLIGEMEKVYAVLTGPVMHVRTVAAAFERAAERGVIWDQPILCILDRVVKENAQVWSRENQDDDL